MRRWMAPALALWLAWPGSAGADAPPREKAEAGDVASQFEMGRRYLLGVDGLEKDATQAAAWFRRAAEQGDVRAQVNLAGLYEEGQGVAKDDAEAVNWLVRAADHGHPRAMFLLGERFEQGRGVPRSLVIAHMWMHRAAGAGSPAARFRVRDLEKRLDAQEREASSRLEALQRQRIHEASQAGSPAAD